ncbi:MAG: hypothetical protein KIT09_34405 [Bryobacteraceae bacterium]|nr:hypothetical protein [Bryobacteraceae bacterium]
MPPEIRFVIVAGLRTGSTLLVDLLDSHPEVRCEGELFAASACPSPGDYLRERLRTVAARAYGFHCKLGQVDSPMSWTFLKELHAAGWRIVHVRRRNLLRQAASAMIAQQRGVWHDRSGANAAAWQVHLDSKRFLQALGHAELADIAYRAVMDRLPHLLVRYEDDLLRPEFHQATADRIFHFLGLPAAPVTARYCRSVSRPLADCIANFDEVVRAVRKTRYGRFLDDPEYA